jgi:ABC-type nitrate/sulfonate/bicarbonate transport system, permease component
VSSASRWALALAPVALLLAVWHAAVVLSGSPIFPTPGQVAAGLVDLARQGLLLKHVVASLFRVTVGYLIAVALAIPVGMLMGWFGGVHTFLNPLVQGLRPISPIAWIPLAILWFGVGDLSPIFLIFLSSFFPMVVGTAAGVLTIDGTYLRAARNFEFSGLHLFRAVVLPAALPQIVTGMRIGLGVAWLVVVAAEMIAVSSGLGYLIIDSRNAGNRYDLVVAGMLVIGAVGFILDGFMRRLERLDEVRWRYET